MLFVSGYHELMRDGLSGFLALIAATIKANRPRFMVIDGFRSAREFSSTELELSQFIHELSAFVTAARCTTLILAPLSGNEPHPEHTLVDGLIELNRYSTGMRRAREIEVHKLRARDHLLGKHFFRITGDGLVTFPRLEARPSMMEGAPDLKSKLAFGIRRIRRDDERRRRERLDYHADRPVRRRQDAALAEVSRSRARTRRALRVLRLLRVAERLVAKAEAVSIRLEAAVKDERLTIQWQPAVELAIDELAAELIAVVKRTTRRGSWWTVSKAFAIRRTASSASGSFSTRSRTGCGNSA